MVEHDPRLLIQRDEQFRSGPEEKSWEMLDDEEGMTAIEEAVASIKATKLLAPPRNGEGDRPQPEAKAGGGGAAPPRRKKGAEE
jgi:hypothetical protein